MIAQHLVGREPAKIKRGLRGQCARIGGEEVAAGRQHVAASARGRAGGSGRNTTAVERGNQRVTLGASACRPGRVSGGRLS